MPKINVNYNNTLIYKIVCNDLSNTYTYVGSTTNFRQRKKAHKYACNMQTGRAYNFKIYEIIRTSGGWDNWSMIEIEKYPCNDGNECRERERYWYELLDANLNTLNPSRSRKQYLQDNQEDIKETRKLYRQNNADKIKQYYQANRLKILETAKNKRINSV